ncbi:MAG: hypothetical protein ABJF23_23625 [Bryobacteraceae bacterium]
MKPFAGSFRRRRLAAVVLSAAAVIGSAAFYFRPVVHAQDNLTPGMLFGPLWVDKGQHLELCSSYLGTESGLTVFAHFRNFSTGEVSNVQEVEVKAGGGGCATYSGKGHVVGMTRGTGPAADWVSPSNALIGTMSVINDNNKNTQATVLGVPKMWAKGL